jgi:hypothetical protein
VAVKENDHNAFRHYENSTTRSGRFLLRPRRDVRQISTYRRVHVVCRQRVIEIEVGSFYKVLSVDSVAIFNER